MIDHAMKEHMVKTVLNNVIAEMLVLVIRKQANALATLDGPAQCAKRNAHSEHLDSIVHNFVIATLTIQ